MDLKEIEETARSEFIWFHQHPELSGEEVETTKRIRDFLSSHGIDMYDTPGLKTGVIGKLGNGKGPTVAIRCDIDALPIQEKTDLPYRSLYDGKMHACGHDFHAATLMGIALALKNEPIDGTVQLVFQPAEENLDSSRDVLKTGVLDHTSVIFGLHCSAMYKRGTIITRPGAMHGATATFKAVFHGKGSHACRPQLSIDPVLMVSSFVMNGQTVISRNLDPFHSALVSITHIQAGTNTNVIPEDGFAEGTVRAVRESDRAYIKDRLRALSEGIARAYGGEAEFLWEDGSPATNNDPEWAAFAKDRALALHLPFAEAPDNLAGEDFAFYQQKIPGVFIQIGTGLSPKNHNPCFRVDPDTLHESILYGKDLALASLEKLRGKKSD